MYHPCGASAVGAVADTDAFSWSVAQAAALRPALERHDSAHVPCISCEKKG